MRTKNQLRTGQLGIINKLRKNGLCGMVGDRASFYGLKIEPRGMLAYRSGVMTSSD